MKRSWVWFAALRYIEEGTMSLTYARLKPEVDEVEAAAAEVSAAKS